jgi:hypothetical protein
MQLQRLKAKRKGGNGSQLNTRSSVVLPIKRRGPQGSWTPDSPPAPAPASPPASSSGAVMLLSAEECLDNGIQQHKAKQVRPQQVKQNEGKCSDEQGDDPVFRVEFEFEHAKLTDTGCCEKWPRRSLEARRSI